MQQALDVLVAAYATEAGSEEALQGLLLDVQRGAVPVKAAVTLCKDSANNLHIIQVAASAMLRDLGGEVVGVTTDCLVRQWLGQSGIESLGKRLQDGSFLEEIRHMGAHLPPGWSALFVIVDHEDAEIAWRAVKDGPDEIPSDTEEAWVLSGSSLHD